MLQYRKVKDNTYIERLKGDLYEINKSTELYNGEGTQKIDFARTHTLIEWVTNKRYNCIDIKDTIVARRFNEYGYKSLEDAINNVEKELQEYAEKYGKYYYNEKNGVVLIFRC